MLTRGRHLLPAAPTMLALLSPAKTLDYERALPDGVVATRPRLAREAGRIARAAAMLSASDLERIMGISEKLATLNAARFKRFRAAPERPAIFAFAGDVYTGLEARTLEPAAIDFAQDHVRMLSGLYGLLRPLDAMRPYRLEMGTRWAPPSRDGGSATLYAHWGDRIGRLLAKDLAAEGSGVVVNLASKEYWHAIAQAPPRKAAIYDIEFLDAFGRDGLRFNSFAAKKARGLMARFLCEHRISRVDDLKGFDSGGYAFDAAGSEDRRWRFVRT